jgi:hypothetical protein
MTTSLNRLVLATLLLGVAATQSDRNAHACSTSTQMTYFGGAIDDWDNSKAVYLLYWGYGTYGDPQSFKAASLAGYTDDNSAGIAGSRWFGATTQYSGRSLSSGNTVFIGNNKVSAGAYVDEGNLPAPVNGVITMDDNQVAAEADRFFATQGFGAAQPPLLGSADDIIVIFLPPNATAPVPACAQHFATPGGHLVAWVSYPDVVPGCNLGFNELAITHELVENAANPQWNYGSSFEGWDQGTGAFCEIGDICESSMFTIQVQPSSNPNSQFKTQPFFSNEAVARGANGCVYARANQANLFGISSVDSQLYQTPINANTSVQSFPSFSWGTPTGVTLTGTPGVTTWGLGRLDAFVRGTNGKVYHAESIDFMTQLNWELLNSTNTFTQNPDAASWGVGNLQVFGVQGTNIVKNTKNFGGSWSGWQTVNKPTGINPSSKVSVAAWGASNISGAFPTTNRTIVAAFRGSDGKVWIGNSTGGSFTWRSFNAPASLTGDVDLSAWAPPRLDLFVMDTSGNLWDMFSNDGTTIAGSTKWGHPSAGQFQLGGTAAGLGDGRLITGGRVGGSGASAFVQLWNWAGTSWVNVGGTYKGGIDVASW